MILFNKLIIILLVLLFGILSFTAGLIAPEHLRNNTLSWFENRFPVAKPSIPAPPPLTDNPEQISTPTPE